MTVANDPARLITNARRAQRREFAAPGNAHLAPTFIAEGIKKPQLGS
jgi:hypothetical protein